MVGSLNYLYILNSANHHIIFKNFFICILRSRKRSRSKHRSRSKSKGRAPKFVLFQEYRCVYLLYRPCLTILNSIHKSFEFILKFSNKHKKRIHNFNYWKIYLVCWYDVKMLKVWSGSNVFHIYDKTVRHDQIQKSWC